MESTRELTQEYKRSLNKKGSISTSPAGNLKSKTKDSHSASKLTSLPTNTTTTTTSSKQPTTTRSTSRPRASPVHTAINAASNRPEVDISHLTANQSFALPAGLSMTTAPRIPRFFAWEGSTNVPVSDIKSPQSTRKFIMILFKNVFYIFIILF